MEYSKALRTILMETGISQAELTRRLGLGSKTAYVSQLCNGKIWEQRVAGSNPVAPTRTFAGQTWCCV